ncbi:MAG TPA: 50S ribosomal protein L25 [Gemmatimonadaceae bacterium]|nr:50S ribosomal protein L25 [Gemmatimonadaceae bacterium]
MASASLSASRRTDVGKGAARKLRAALKVPGIIYGHHREATALTIDARELEKLLDSIAVGSTVVEVAFDGTSARTLIREVQRHPFKRQVLHIDFQELVAGEKVTVEVPIVLNGVPEGVRNDGGTLDQVMRTLQVEVDPANIPSHIAADVTALGLNDSIHVSDLQIPDGVTVMDDLENTVCVVVPPRIEAEPTPVAEGAEPEAAAEPELIRKPKEEEEGEAE